ncbi:ankyrin repeat and protein kinase domain-containing protein 1-like [Lingula anatina]|uniref:Ankyrin repeat and protein kinase domain-containing protein 1-like n=1 Tax=Lingula anatina TaxID=7574 RepID=A0A1S3HFN4_LINAN|nr:ankyrin repeat and protein kinase domain-containing protein 1-like [Lingula anatina]|eukprot:XP_013384855.1 ankyrin repeat and protein kinase domain-containing protein 1-like [Lingula anatina]
MSAVDLFKAAKKGDMQRLTNLLRDGTLDVNKIDLLGGACTPLHMAAQHGATQCVQLLLQHGADPNIQDWRGRTPLHWAVELGATQCVQLLLQHGADPNIQDGEGSKPLHMAARQDATQCLQLLLQHGADPNIQSKSIGRQTLLMGAGRRSPLHWAAQRGATQCIQLLLQHGADPNIQDIWWRHTPLQDAAEQGATQCVQLLLQHGADYNIQDLSARGRTPLHLAVKQGATECVQLLLQHGADPNIQDWLGCTPLYLAAEQGATQCVQLLLQHGADPNIQCGEKSFLLLPAGGRTPLHLAAQRGATQCVQLLLQHKANPNKQDAKGCTPLHLAAEHGATQCIQLLLQHGADPNVSDGREVTPYTLAKKKGLTAIAEYLCRVNKPGVQGHLLKRAFLKLCDHIKLDDCRMLARYHLGIGDIEIDDIDMTHQFNPLEQRFQILSLWRNKKSEASVKMLIDALKAAELVKTAEVIEQYYVEELRKVYGMSAEEYQRLTAIDLPDICPSALGDMRPVKLEESNVKWLILKWCGGVEAIDSGGCGGVPGPLTTMGYHL